MSNTESNGDGRSVNLPGLYRHPESGAEVIVTPTPKFGSPMADGVVQVGYKYIGPAPSKTVKTEEVSETKSSK